MIKTKLIGSLVLVTCLVGGTVAKAALVTYTWVQDSTSVAGYTTSGTLVYNTVSGAVTPISFTEANPALLPPYSGTVINFIGTAAVLPPGLPTGDLQLSGISTGTQTGGGFILQWVPNLPASLPMEQVVNDNTVITGAWVPVPEPTAAVAGAMLLLPFGASTLRMFRRNSRTA
jgi:hypothetical protein